MNSLFIGAEIFTIEGYATPSIRNIISLLRFFRGGIIVSSLDQEQIVRHLDRLPGWVQNEYMIEKDYSFADFVEAVNFVDALVKPAESAQHHPDLTVSWGSVSVSLTTHEEDGLTEKDFQLAETIDQIYQEEFQNE